MSTEGSDPSGPQTAEAFDHLAVECWFHNQLTDAADNYRRALAIREQSFGPDHWEVADSIVRLAGACSFAGDHAEAESLWYRAIRIYEPYYRELMEARGELFEHMFMSLAGVLGNIAIAAFERGDTVAAERGYRRVGALIAEAFGPDCRWLPVGSPFATALIEQGKQGGTDWAAALDAP